MQVITTNFLRGWTVSDACRSRLVMRSLVQEDEHEPNLVSEILCILCVCSAELIVVGHASFLAFSRGDNSDLRSQLQSLYA